MGRAALIAIILLLCCPAAPAAAASWSQDQASAQAMAQAGDLAGAADAAARAVKTAKAELGASDPRLHDLLILTGKLHIQAGQKAAARRYLQYALILLEKTAPDGPRVREVKKLLAQAQGPDLALKAPVSPRAEAPKLAPTQAPQAPPATPSLPPAPLPGPQQSPPPQAPPMPAGVEITSMEIVEFGIYSTSGTEPESEFASRQTLSDADVPGQGKAGRVKESKLIESTDQVPNRAETTFGLAVMVRGRPEGSEVPIVIRMTSPPRVVDARGTRVSIEEFDSPVALGQGIWYGHTISEPPQTRPAGDWTVQFLAGGRVMAEKVFHLGPPQ